MCSNLDRLFDEFERISYTDKGLLDMTASHGLTFCLLRELGDLEYNKRLFYAINQVFKPSFEP